MGRLWKKVGLHVTQRHMTSCARSQSICALAQGRIVGGSYYENCAFNPSISPLKSGGLVLLSVTCISPHPPPRPSRPSPHFAIFSLSLPLFLARALAQIK